MKRPGRTPATEWARNPMSCLPSLMRAQIHLSERSPFTECGAGEQRRMKGLSLPNSVEGGYHVLPQSSLSKGENAPFIRLFLTKLVRISQWALVDNVPSEMRCLGRASVRTQVPRRRDFICAELSLSPQHLEKRQAYSGPSINMCLFK